MEGLEELVAQLEEHLTAAVAEEKLQTVVVVEETAEAQRQTEDS